MSQLPGNPNIKKSYKQFEVANEFKDNLGYTHYTLKPKVDNYVVEDKEVKIHTNDNQELELVNGDVNTEKLHIQINKVYLKMKRLIKLLKVSA